MGFLKKMVKKVLCNLRSLTRKRTPAETERTGFEENKKESQISSDLKAMVEKPTHEWGKRGKNIGQDQGAFAQELNKNKYRATPMVNEGFENGKKTGTAHSSMLEGKGNSKRLTQHVNTSQSTERKWKNVNGNLKSEEGKNEDKMKIDKQVFRRKLEEERERERENDRNAVERATREVTERVYAESPGREAVDRESAETRQRVMAVTREILDKNCAEAKEKLSADKASSMTARIRAERTAVENPTAETPEHVVEKRMAKKAAFEASERAERSDSSSGARDTYSSAHAAFVGNFEGVEGESAQRCNSRLERQQTQTRECAALAEKKKRDRQAEREQAERDSFAESVDAKVEMWSSKKDLPAMISTLQYILWTDSGWQPIPLKDVKTAIAVKKAYRKAALLLHPDKLQQCDATNQQKYIGEKVFYHLKEAWNKFNSEAQ